MPPPRSAAPPLATLLASARGDVLVAGTGRTARLAGELPRDARVHDLDALTPEAAAALPDAVDLLVLLAPSLADLRRLPALLPGLPKARRLHLVARLHRAAVLRPPLAPVPRPQEVRVERGGQNSPWTVHVRHLRPVDVRPVVAGVLGSSGYASAVAPGALVGTSGPAVADWVAGAAAPRRLGPTGGDPDRQPEPLDAELTVDVLVRTGGSGPVTGAAAVLDVVPPDAMPWDRADPAELDRLAALGPLALPPVDERAVFPLGFLVSAGEEEPQLAWTPEGWSAGPRRLGDHRGRLTDADVEELRDCRAVRLDPRETPGPLGAACAVATLGAAGVPLRVDPRPGWLAALLGDPLAHLLDPTDADLADPLRREEHSVRLRRAALLTHGTTARWAQLAAHLDLRSGRRPTEPEVGVVLATRRPESLAPALRSISRQRGVRLQLVVAAHGFDPAGPVAAPVLAEARTRLSVDVVAVPADVPFGAALDRAAARTTAPLLAKMDDDDWYGPDHLADLALAARCSGADLVGCAAEVVYLEPLDLTVRRTWTGESYGRNLAGGTLLVRRSTYDAVGGFRPVPRSVDRELIRAVVAAGGLVYRTTGLGYVLRRGAEGHTWSSPLGYFLVPGAPQWPGFRPSALLEHDSVEAVRPRA